MQTIGITLMAVGLWVSYCAALGLPPLDTAVAIIRNPGSYSDILAKAKAASKEKYSSLIAAAQNVKANLNIGNPFQGLKESQGITETHKGIDYPMASGTPLPAIFGGTVQNLVGQGASGDVTQITLDDGYKLIYKHVSAFKKANGAVVTPGTIVALSGGVKGAKGAGASTGAHVHVEMRDPSGQPLSYLSYLGKQGYSTGGSTGKGASSAGGGGGGGGGW
jgi:murein DD-endopeptidase MepM/ murein hydrolase activator NlpD